MVHIDKLPFEILALIFQFVELNTTLSNNDFYQLKFVSKKWKDIYHYIFKIHRSKLFKAKYILAKRRDKCSHDPPRRYPFQINEKIDQIKVDFGLGGKIIYKIKENIVSKEPCWIFDTFQLVSFEEYDKFDKSECINCEEMTYCCNYFEYNISDEMCEFDCSPKNIYNFDASYYREYYMLRLYTIKIDGEKSIVNIKIDNLFFDIKLKNLMENTIESYVEEFNPDSYEILKY
ncbi:26799_t:CDS:2 [Gigaspora margarita]|uniref:26799_t:CDS:1 n=1 Tax=Gigaspora margarita TaxID=4874 RepID=A0ABN7WBZ4_GIGMA|nr:26799_t:CDS:2 [Gigaspora margarita]